MSRLFVSKIADVSAVSATTSYALGTSIMTQPREISAVWTTADADGTIKVQLSMDNTNWTDLETATSLGGANGSKHWVLGRHVPYVRVTYTKSAGTVTTLKIYSSFTEYVC